MGGQNATPVNGRGCLGQPQVLTPSYRPHVPQQASQDVLPAGRQLHTLPQLNITQGTAAGT